MNYDRIDNAIKRFKLDNTTAYEADGTRGLWIQGPPGTGKSRKARDISMDKYKEIPFTLE